jgi:predicted flap endonuclease-1-like 5' DNA nuclease
MLYGRPNEEDQPMGGMENDLYKLNGIGPRHTEMLESIGVDSIKELSHRNAESLKEMIETRHGSVVGLSVAQVQDWIDQAKALQQ